MAYYIIDGPPLSAVEQAAHATDGVELPFKLETETKRYLGVRKVWVKRVTRRGSMYEIQGTVLVNLKPVACSLYYNPHPDCDAASPNRKGWQTGT